MFQYLSFEFILLVALASTVNSFVPFHAFDLYTIQSTNDKQEPELVVWSVTKRKFGRTVA